MEYFYFLTCLITSENDCTFLGITKRCLQYFCTNAHLRISLSRMVKMVGSMDCWNCSMNNFDVRLIQNIPISNCNNCTNNKDLFLVFGLSYRNLNQRKEYWRIRQRTKKGKLMKIEKEYNVFHCICLKNKQSW